jgi:general secretion pathway protein K
MIRQRGIALIQVLLITGIIGLLMLQMGLTAREQVARAQALADRAELQLAAQSRESALLYSLLTEPLVQNLESDNPYAVAWNFHGVPFVVDGITFTIQDESGRMRVPDQDGADFEQLLLGLEVAPDRARRLTGELLELQGSRVQTRALGEADRAVASSGGGLFPLQDLSQLRLLPGMDPALFARLRPLLTLYPTPGFNPTTAPRELLAAQLTASQASGLADARADGDVDALTLWKLTGSQADETTVLAPGPGLTVRLEMGLRQARTTRTTTFMVRPYEAEAVAVWQRSRDVTGQDE